MGLLEKFSAFLKIRKPQNVDSTERYLELLEKDPENARAHLKLAGIYEKKREKQKAISEYLLAADIFAKNNFYAWAMAIYKKLPQQDPSLDHVYLKIADIYRKMGFLGDAFAQYRILVQHYDGLGMRNKALDVMKLMAEMDPRKTALKGKGSDNVIQFPKGEEELPGLEEVPSGKFFDLGAELKAAEPLEIDMAKEVSSLEKLYGVEEIFQELKETGGSGIVDPDFNYSMGVAYREMGFIDDAIEQFQVALKKGQKPFDALTLLGLCYKEKGLWDEAHQSFEKALGVGGIPQEQKLNVKYELGLLYQEQGRTEEALELLREIAAVDQGFRKRQDEIFKIPGKFKAREKSSRR